MLPPLELHVACCSVNVCPSAWIPEIVGSDVLCGSWSTTVAVTEPCEPGAYLIERPSAGIADLRAALEAFEDLPRRPDLARRALAALCTRHGLPQATAVLHADG